MAKTKKIAQKGDTLVEVLVVTAILSLVVVSANLLMNRAFAGTQAAMEQTIVRHAVEGQVEMLTFARDRAITAPASLEATIWKNQVLPRTGTTVSPYGSCISGTNPRRFNLAMSTNGSTLLFNATPTAATNIADVGRGVWIEGYRPSPTTNYVDFHVYGCWEAPASGPNLTTGTVLRLYVP